MPNNILTVTVSQLVTRISTLFGREPYFSDICVRGEISNLSYNTSSGHIYFTLKDKDSIIKAVMFRNSAVKLASVPQDGMSVTVRGAVRCYSAGGYYQIVVSSLSVEGEGALSVQFERLKNKLAAEHLFERKRSLPEMPEKICIITSDSGKAIDDFKTNIEKRYPLVRIIFIPAMVQGEAAPDSLISAIKKANTTDAELIIFGRGGGGSEDLSAFNSEALAREIYASRIPTVSAVGHDTDFSISDFVADKYVSTPSAAASVLPDARALIAAMEGKLKTISAEYDGIIERKLADLKFISEKIASKSPVSKLDRNERDIEAISEKLSLQMKHYISDKETLFSGIFPGISDRIRFIIGDKSSGLDAVYPRLSSGIHLVAEKKEHRLQIIEKIIEAKNPAAILGRGYSITYKDKHIVDSISAVEPGEKIRIRLADGDICAVVEKTERN